MKGRRLFVLALIVVSGLALALLSVFLFAVQIVASDRQRTTSFRGTRTIGVAAETKGDDYCDSPGPRRPGEIDEEEMLSSACSFWLPGIRIFSCKDSTSKIFLSRIGDGVCDCSSCEDEASLSLTNVTPEAKKQLLDFEFAACVNIEHFSGRLKYALIFYFNNSTPWALILKI